MRIVCVCVCVRVRADCVCVCVCVFVCVCVCVSIDYLSYATGIGIIQYCILIPTMHNLCVNAFTSLPV